MSKSEIIGEQNSTQILEKQNTYSTARACIKPMTSGIFPVSLFP